jgi:hypothetical protein
VRARLHKILAEARAAQTCPWEPTRISLYRTIFPQMTLWLPEDEGTQLRFEFETDRGSRRPEPYPLRRSSNHRMFPVCPSE